MDERIPMEKRNKRMYVGGIVLAVLILAAVGGVGWLRSRLETEVVKTGPAPTLAPAESDGEETIGLNREEISLEVLNGSGVAGAAGKTAQEFEDLGYIIVKTGNAEDTKGNKLYVSSELADRISLLLADVKESLGIESFEVLVDSSASARIILGQ